MWGMYSCRVVFPLILLFSSCAVATQAQEAAGMPESAATATDAKSATDEPSFGQAKTGARAAASAEPDVSSVPGAQVRVLKDGEEIPERKNSAYEDWSRPELTRGMKMEIVPLGQSNGDGFTRELISVQWREMDPIDLWVVKPAGVKNPPVVLYLYSYNASNSRYSDPEFCRFLTRDGFAAVGFVSALTEQRFHDRARIQTFVSQLQEALGATVHDVQLILNYLVERGDFDMSRVGMWGDGSGASIAIMAAAADSRIKVLDLLDPWGDWPDWLAKSSLVTDKDRAEYVTPEFLQSVENLEPLKLLPKLSERKVRLQYIEDGLTVTPAIVREKMESAIPPNIEIVHYKSTQEFVSNVASKGRGFDWIKGRVAQTSSAKRDLNTKTSLELQNSKSRGGQTSDRSR